MGLVHQTLRVAFGLLLDPVARLDPLAGLVLVSAVSGLVLLFAFKWTSRPAAIRRAKQRIQANLLAVRIYRDDLAVVARAQGRTFAALGAYMGNMVLPFSAVLVPFALLFAQLDARYGARALHPGEATLVTATLAPEAKLGEWSLEAAPGVLVDSRPVRIAARREISWRLRAVEPGLHEVVLRAGHRRVEKDVRVAAEATGASRLRARASLEAFLFAPTEAPIAASSGVESIAVAYPPLDLDAFGWSVSWIVVFLVVSAVVAFGLRKRAGVEF